MKLVTVYELYETDGLGCVQFLTRELAEANRDIFEETDVAIDSVQVWLSSEEIELLKKGKPIFCS